MSIKDDKVEIEVQARIIDRLPGNALSLRNLDEMIPLGIQIITDDQGQFMVEIPLTNQPSFYKIILQREGYQELFDAMVKVEANEITTVDFQLVPLNLTPDDLEILTHKHEQEKQKLYQENLSYIQELTEWVDTPPPPGGLREKPLKDISPKATYPVPDQVYVCDLKGFTGWMDFDEFISGVVSIEMGDSFPMEALKAQAVAARSYALERYERTGCANGGQAYTSNIGPKSQEATVSTTKIVILYSGDVISAYYSARCNGDSTLNSEDGVWHNPNVCDVGGNYIPYARSRPCSGHSNCSSYPGEDPCCYVFTGGRWVYIYGHGVGMCQRGAQGFANGGEDWRWIIMNYYTNVELANDSESPQNKTLVQPSDGPYSGRVYWLQNNRLYWITSPDIISQMSSLPGWSHINPHPQSELSGFEGWPDGVARFIDPSDPRSDGILIQYSPEAVFITENGKRRGFTHSEALTFYGGLLGYGFDDVIEVTKPVRDMFPEGDPICYPGQGAPNPQLFKDCYFRVVSYEGKSKYDLFGMAHTLADPWGDGLTQHFRKDSNELAMMRPDSKNVAYAIYGGIWAKYRLLGNPPSFLGYPFSDEREADPSGADGFNTQGRVQDFEHGILVYHRTGSRAGQTFEIHGEIYPTYIQNGASGGWLGFPISDVYKDPKTGYDRSDFEGGCITTLDGVNYYAYGELNADFSGTPREGEKPLTVNFTDLSSGKSTKWQWDFGDEGTSTQKNPSHTYQDAGYYTVTLTVSNPYDSDTETKTNYIHVIESCVSPVANFTGTPRDGCASLTVNFTDQSTGNPTSWSWSFGDGGTSTQQNPSHTYANPGTYTVSLTASNQCGSDTETKTNYITVLPEPIADFVGTPTKGDAPLTVQFNDNSTGTPTNWSWSFGDGGTSTEQNPQHTYTSPGTYTVSLTATNDCGSDTETKTDYIEVTEPGQSPVADFEGNPTQGCAPLTVQFTDQSTGEPTSWSWTFGDEGTSTVQNPSHTYNNPGKYTVSLTVTNQFGSNTETKTDYITVLPKPTADFVAEPTSGDAPLTVQFTDQSTDNPTSWQWDFGDGGSSTEQNPSHTYTNPGKYTVSLTATNDCGSDTKTIPDCIEVIPPDEPDISVEPTSLDFGKVVVEDSAHEALTISNDGNADLEVTNITADKPDFSVSENYFIIPPSDSHEITVTFTPQAEGEITENLTIESNDPDEGTLPVPVTGLGVPYVNRALSLDGYGDYVSVSDSASLDVNNTMTLSAWINFDQLPSEVGSVYRIVTKDDVGVSRAFAFGISSRDKLYFEYLSDDTTITTEEADIAFVSGDSGTWKHVAVTVIASSKTVKLYINSALVDSTQDLSHASSIQDSTADLLIGARKKNGTPELFFDGEIDEARIWNTALTQDQIQSPCTSG